MRRLGTAALVAFACAFSLSACAEPDAEDEVPPATSEEGAQEESAPLNDSRYQVEDWAEERDSLP